MPTINLNGLSNPQNADILLFSKSTWAGSWTHQPNAMVEDIAWTHAPDVSVASFQWRYGDDIVIPGGSGFASVSPLSGRGDYILILLPLSDGSFLPWLGYADLPVILEEDNVSGIQRVPCYGFDRALQYASIMTTVRVDPDDATKWIRNDLGAVFNGQIKGNRTAAMVKVEDTDPDPTVYAFENPGVESQEWWSSQDIVQHIATFHLPTATLIPGTLPWTITGLTRLPGWDQPKLVTDGRSIHECLTEIAGAERMLGWRVMPAITLNDPDPLVAAPTVDAINIEFFSRAPSAITLPGVTDLPANHDILTIVHDEDPLTDSTIDEDDSDTVDQLIVRGPREVAVGTFQWNSDWVAGWTPTELTEYQDGYSGSGFWATSSLSEKRAFNQYFRGLPKYEDVYRTFPIKDDWDGTCTLKPLFWKSDPGDDNYIPYLGNVMFMDRLPLFRGVDYTGDVSAVDESRGRQTLPILVFIERPDLPNRYVTVQNFLLDYGAPRVNFPNSLEFEMRVSPYFDRGPGFRIDVLGAPQHAHRPSFTGNDGDPETINPKMWGEVDSETMHITAAMVGDRRPEIRLPASVSADFVRKKYITLDHPGLQHVQIAERTVMSLDKDGVRVRSNGGTLRDPFEMLTALATLAAERVLTPRKTAKLRTGRTLALEPGSLITSLNGATVNAVISEVRVSTPVVENGSPPPLTMSIMAIDNDLDITNLVARVPVPEVDR